MHLYETNYGSPRKGNNASGDTVTKDLQSNTFTLTALVAPVSMTGFPTFQANELHLLQETATFHIAADKIPADIHCSCLQGGRFCLSGTHWLLEYSPGSKLWLGEDGARRTGSAIRYTGEKKGGRSVDISDGGERICCVEGVVKGKHEGVVPPAQPKSTRWKKLSRQQGQKTSFDFSCYEWCMREQSNLSATDVV